MMILGIVLNENSNNDNFDLEYVYLDENMVELLSVNKLESKLL